jgi:AcrR family transcriptional regulator
LKAKRKSRIETEQKIFDAGLSVFSQYGFEAASLKQIAQKAGVNEALIIRYYQSKANLLMTIIIEYANTQKAAWEGLPEYATIEEELREFFLREISSDFKNRDFIRITLAQICVDSKLRRDTSTLWSDWANEGNPEFIRRLKRFQENGSIANSVDLASLSYLLELEALSFGLAISIQPAPDRALIERHATTFATIIARGLQCGEVNMQAIRNEG